MAGLMQVINRSSDDLKGKDIMIEVKLKDFYVLLYFCLLRSFTPRRALLMPIVINNNTIYGCVDIVVIGLVTRLQWINWANDDNFEVAQ